MSGRVCSCGCTEVLKSDSRGDTVCTACGSVLEESAIVDGVEFAQTGTGGHAAIGQFLASDGSQRISIGGMRSFSQDSRQATIAKAKRRIQLLAGQLNLNQHCQETALNYFTIVLNKGHTRGRPSSHTIAACLYITCRMEGTSHMLLDFSDILRVNLYELGQVFNFIRQSLSLQFPTIDPCTYVQRYAHALKFGDQEQKVALLAVRLVKKMQHDWIGLGRRPSGLCGAALLLAARYYNFNRTIRDIVKVVQIGDSAVKRRLNEFAATPSSTLTLDEFKRVDLEAAADPPSFKEGRERERRRKEAELAVANEVADELPQLSSQVDEAIKAAEAKRRITIPGVSLSAGDEPRKRALDSGELWLPAEDGLTAEDIEAANSFFDEEVLEPAIEDESCLPDPSDVEYDANGQLLTPAQRLRRRGLVPSLEGLGLGDEGPSRSLGPGEVALTTEYPEEEELTSDLDDDEISRCILSEAEAAVKEKVWMLRNGRHLEEIEERRKQREEEEANRRANVGQPRRKRRRQNVDLSAFDEANQKIVQEKKLSSKINYDVLKNLTSDAKLLPNSGLKITDVSEDCGGSLKVESVTKRETKEEVVNALDQIRG